MIKIFTEEAGVELRMSRVYKWMMQLASFFSPHAKEIVEIVYEYEQPFIVESSNFENIWYENHVDEESH